VSRQITAISSNTISFAYSFTAGNYVAGAASVITTKNVTVNLATDGTGAAVSLASDVVRAIKTSQLANALVYPVATGHGRGVAGAAALAGILPAIRVKQVVSGLNTALSVSVSGN